MFVAPSDTEFLMLMKQNIVNKNSPIGKCLAGVLEARSKSLLSHLPCKRVNMHPQLPLHKFNNGKLRRYIVSR